jgi:PAS domain S-box-containing protein
MSTSRAVLVAVEGQRLLDHLSTLVRVWTPAHGVVFVNRAWCELTGTTVGENLGDGWLAHVHEADRANVAATLASPAGAAQVRADYRLLSRDGQTVMVSDAPSPYSEEGSPDVVGVIHTVTPHGAATPVDPERTKSMSKWAHELRGPLNAILGWSDLLSAGENAPDVVQRGLKAIANNARQQAGIIKRMTE